jgi:hypothetical protein
MTIEERDKCLTLVLKIREDALEIARYFPKTEWGHMGMYQKAWLLLCVRGRSPKGSPGQSSLIAHTGDFPEHSTGGKSSQEEYNNFMIATGKVHYHDVMTVK